MTMTSPLRGPKSPEGGGFAAAHPLARRAGYGAAPSGPKTATHRLRRRPAAGLDPGDHCDPWGQEERAGPGLPPARRAARKPLQWRGPQEQAERQDTGELAFDSQKERENYKPRVVSRIK